MRASRGSREAQRGPHCFSRLRPALKLKSVLTNHRWQNTGTPWGAWMFSSDLFAIPKQMVSRVFFGSLVAPGESTLILRYFSLPVGGGGWSLFINEYFGVDLT